MSKFYTNVFSNRGKICYTEYNNGIRQYKEQEFCPSLFIHSNKRSDYKDLFGKSVEQINFGSIKEFTDYKKSYKKTLNLFGDIEPKYQFISEEYADDIEYNSKQIRTFLYDIEVINIYDDPKLDGFPLPQEAKVPVVGITIKDLKSGIYHVLSVVNYDPKKSKIGIDEKNICYTKFLTESDLLKAFVNLFVTYRPDLLIGWYNKGFDDSYMCNRIQKILGDIWLKKLSPSGQVRFSFRENKYGKMEPRVTIQGVQILDYIELYKKFLPGGRESFSLDFISSYELKDNKVQYDEYDDLKEFYTKNPQLATDYNIKDVELIHLIDNKLKLIDLVFTIAYMSKVNYEDILSPIKTWDAIIFNYLKKDMIVIPPSKQHIKEPYPGAYVHEPVPGIYDWVVSLDLNSLYPNCVCQYNLSPETIIDLSEDVNQEEIDIKILNKEITPNKDYIMSGSGQYFRKDIKGLFPTLMENMYSDRKIIKKQMIEVKKQNVENPSVQLTNEISRLDNIQKAIKTQMNSFYGILANVYFRYYDIRLPRAITLSGQLAIKSAEIELTNYLRTKFKAPDDIIKFGDTDSIGISLDFIVKKLKEKEPKKIVNYLDKFSKKFIEPELDKIYDELASYMNVNEDFMKMKREKIIERFLITGKKKYAYMMWDNEGVRYKEPKFKVTGIEIVRSSTPQIIKPFLKEAIIKLMYNPEDIHNYIKEVKDKFLLMKPEDISFPRGVTNVNKYTTKNGYRKGTPIAVRAAIIYNMFIKRHGLNFPPATDGGKVRFIYTLQPNSFNHENVFGWIRRIPKREEILKYIDYNTQFDKVFFNVVKTISERAGFTILQRAETNLDDMF